MNLPSRGDSWSATTMRYSGIFFRPMRRRRMRVDMFSSSECGLAGESAASERQLQTGAPGLPRDLHELLHLLELAQEGVDLLYRAARALGNPEPPLTVDQVGIGPLLGGHREHDCLYVLELLVIQLGRLQHGGIDARQHTEHVLERPHLLH